MSVCATVRGGVCLIVSYTSEVHEASVLSIGALPLQLLENNAMVNNQKITSSFSPEGSSES